MHRHDRHGTRPYVIPVAILSVSFLACAVAVPADERVTAVDRQGVTSVEHNGKPLLEYRSQPNPMKLYVSRWYTPQGTQVLRDSPHDHVHHRALMYAIGIDGCDFWSEEPADQYGRQLAADAVQVTARTANGRSQVVIRQPITWVDTAGQVLATESRTITAHCDVIPAASLLTWAFTLTPTEAKPEIELWGRHYFGLGMRFVETMDTGAELMFAGDAPSVEVRGSEKLTRATWCAMRGTAEGKPITVAMFDAPGNPRHPATWFTMDTPFAYLSATMNLDAEKLTISRQQPLQAQYGVAIWDGTVDAAVIERAYRTWLELATGHQ
jgi:hypothetical protein